MKEENETRNNVMSLKRAETIAGKYLCNRCWKPLDVIRTGQQKGYPICANKQKGLCDGGSGIMETVFILFVQQISHDEKHIVYLLCCVYLQFIHSKNSTAGSAGKKYK